MHCIEEFIARPFNISKARGQVLFEQATLAGGIKWSYSVKWYGPYGLNRCYFHDTSGEKGIYMVTRKWGSTHESLKYIGLTKRNLRQRITEHGWWLSQLK